MVHGLLSTAVYRALMTNGNALRVRQAYERYANGDLAPILDLVDPDLEWTFLDPSEADPVPRVCHGRNELKQALERQRAQGLHSALEDVIDAGDRVVIVTHTPGLDAFRARKAGDRNVDVVTFRDDRIIALRACRTRAEALALAGLS